MCNFWCTSPRLQSSWHQHGTHLGPAGPRWAPCWPHESCYQGCFPIIVVMVPACCNLCGITLVDLPIAAEAELDPTLGITEGITCVALRKLLSVYGEYSRENDCVISAIDNTVLVNTTCATVRARDCAQWWGPFWFFRGLVIVFQLALYLGGTLAHCLIYRGSLMLWLRIREPWTNDLKYIHPDISCHI